MPTNPETTAEHIALIKAHTLNELQHSPQSVTAHDRLFLVGEIERLRTVMTACIDAMDDQDYYSVVRMMEVALNGR